MGNRDGLGAERFAHPPSTSVIRSTRRARLPTWSGARRSPLSPGAAFEQALRGLLRDCGIAHPGRSRRAPDRRARVGLDARGPSDAIRHVQDHVVLHVGEVRTLGELADVTGLSRAHFARRFHRETGEAPWAFVRRVRDAEAVRRLEAGESLAEVAYASGYADQAHLTRSLRRRTGRDPAPGRGRPPPRPREHGCSRRGRGGGLRLGRHHRARCARPDGLVRLRLCPLRRLPHAPPG